MYLYVVTEDELSEAVLRRLLRQFAPHLHVANAFRRSGNGFILSNVRRWTEIGTHHRIIVLVDLDAERCAPAFLDRYFPGRDHARGLHVRVAVREVEAWLLADASAVSAWLRRPLVQVPPQPDELDDPKLELLRLASRAPAELRDDLVRSTRDRALYQGIGCQRRFDRGHSRRFVLYTFAGFNSWCPPR